MTAEENNYAQFLAMRSKYRRIIELLGKMFYPADISRYRDMVCDLTTYLWQVCCGLPAGTVFDNEEAWVYTVLHHEAARLARAESDYQSHFDYGADLSGVVYDDGVDPSVRRMYRLIDRLGRDDREIVMMYLDGVPVSQIASGRGKSTRYVYRWIEKIINELRRLNTTLGDDIDDDEAYIEVNVQCHEKKEDR